MLTKDEIRDKLMKQRLSLDPQDVAVRSAAINDKAVDLVKLPNIQTIHVFEPIPALNEVKIEPLTGKLQAIHPQATIYTTRNVGEEWQIVTLDGQIQGRVPVLDLVIVPMLGFALDLHRLGYGGGYYDYLLHNSPDAKKIGVCYDFGKLDKIPVEPHDIRLHAIVTERGTYMR